MPVLDAGGKPENHNKTCKSTIWTGNQMRIPSHGPKLFFYHRLKLYHLLKQYCCLFSLTNHVFFYICVYLGHIFDMQLTWNILFAWMPSVFAGLLFIFHEANSSMVYGMYIGTYLFKQNEGCYSMNAKRKIANSPNDLRVITLIITVFEVSIYSHK